MFINYGTNILIMAEEKSLIVKLAVPVVIFLALALCGTCVYVGWFNTTALGDMQPGFTILMQMIAYMSFGVVFFLTLGTLAKYYKFRQDELDRWGEDALSGKPPL
jgi:hypothetical protein